MELEEDLLKREYNKRRTNLVKIERKIIEELNEDLEGIEYVDGVYGRVKSKKSFITKVLKNKKNYRNPFRDVEDMIGIRILVLFPTVSGFVSTRIKDGIFPAVEHEYMHEKSEKAFGYEGYQSIHSIPESYIEANQFDDLPRVFELQVRTLFQHAWAETEHEINYKRRMKFPSQQEFEYKRSFAWLSASCWGSDKILDGLYEKYIELRDGHS